MNEFTHLRQRMDSFSPLGEEAWEDFVPRWSSFELSKGEFLIREGKTERYFYFVHEGVLRAFVRNGGQESVLGFSYEGDFSGAYDSFLDQAPSEWSIDALSSVRGLKISYENLMAMYDAYKSMERWGRVFNAKILIGIGRRQVEVRNFSAEDRFERLMKDSPHILQKVPQKYLASYLGMSPETFSRLRKVSLEKSKSMRT
ncbi:Crp/Fnr family transcriptional regulator [Gilvimarinus agarilyticus]|uniref:cAMP-binding domain of CRP or a regulatory subunit of cAMP-dependent protein kinases n=1 Tax=Reichenbachiella agariperforans TaxID=156994 RepID=A0A1M6W053_REIAG|nr:MULTISPECIES: Crp/Fnr family transcriptional regulator [Reichenbachiella]MBU2885875.1 Crp/Fnr family transcriptional regulator [Gilvimarinus agarilyticus]MBU2915258.1 Crp/Fnr family transcriptional regulator [Reichenbachiella agariperforans]RJE70919.1 transcriptional regulator [Reichenbachiella sp. MSK19-1]SHK86988.1 cAMP-binding domain of CRP or a regulatory subunit of cAMP-dependent protein kinases [Reichenbachiella agariperforans]